MPCLLQSPSQPLFGLITQHLLFLIWESTIVWQDQITVGKEIMLTAVPLTERNQNYWSTISRLKNIISGNFTAKSRLKRPQPKIYCDLVWAKIHLAREKDNISKRAPWLVVAHLDYSCRKNNSKKLQCVTHKKWNVLAVSFGTVLGNTSMPALPFQNTFSAPNFLIFPF